MALSEAPPDSEWVLWLDNISAADTPKVGGKNSSLGEMLGALQQQGIRVPPGFAVTASAYRQFVRINNLDSVIQQCMAQLDTSKATLAQTGKTIRQAFLEGQFPKELADAVCAAYEKLCQRFGKENADVAVRSSATAEDLPEASFAGQQESFLNICGKSALLSACQRCFASLFTDRAIAYREQHGFGHLDVALSVGVQQMVRSDRACAGVAFTLDTDTGFPRLVLISGAWGLGENIVQGTIEADQYRVFKPFLGREDKHAVIEKHCGKKERTRVYASAGAESTTVDVDTPLEKQIAFVLSDDEITQLARWAVAIEEHYQKPMDIEWAKDGLSGELFVVQARPETVHARAKQGILQRFELHETGTPLARGLAIGQAIAAGDVHIVRKLADGDAFPDGAVLVTEMTDPDWVPLMRRASAVVTNHGGRTSHAAIVARELGIPAVVGTGNATKVLSGVQEVTIACEGGAEGVVYEGRLLYSSSDIDVSNLPQTRTRIMMNIASPEGALSWWRLPTAGIGLARMEYLVNNIIRIHPMALVHFDRIEDPQARSAIEEITCGHSHKTAFFVDKLSAGIALMAAASYPNAVVVRLSDFKTNEYAELLGGRAFEPDEQNPMLGWRGASRYYDPDYRDGFSLECQALLRVREYLGFDNIIPMVPFCRTPQEADKVLEVMAEEGLQRGKNGLQVWVMAEVPSNIIECAAFSERFDGFSIGSNDLTQLVLGVGRDAEKLSGLFDESSPSVKWMIRRLSQEAHAHGRTVSLCGQAPSDRPEFAKFLVDVGLDSISVNPDSVPRVLEHVARAEAQRDSALPAEHHPAP